MKHWSFPAFKTKKVLVETIRNIANSTTPNTPLVADDEQFVRWVLSHHYEIEEKSGAGIAHIEVRMNRAATGVTRGFWIVRTDGSAIDISWVVAVNGKSSAKSNAVAAARYEVTAQRDAFRDDALAAGAPCEICGESLTRANCHVDHVHPMTFDALFACFLFEHCGGAVETCEPDGDSTSLQFKDRVLAQKWRDYHQTHAVLRLIHAHENLSIGNRGQ